MALPVAGDPAVATVLLIGVKFCVAKKSFVLVRMVSTATKADGSSTGYFKVKKRNVRAEKLSLRGYDPVVRKHVEFKEKKIK